MHAAVDLAFITDADDDAKYSKLQHIIAYNGLLWRLPPPVGGGVTVP